MKRHGIDGLVSNFDASRRCSRCDYPLVHSRLDGIPVAFKINTRKCADLVCIGCLKHYKLRYDITDEILTEFSNSFVEVPTPKRVKNSVHMGKYQEISN